VLVVDDQSAMVDFLVQGLTGIGFGVEGATSGDEALRSVKLHEFDAVITDLRMAGVSGFDLCRALAERAPDVPVIVLTAFGDYPAAVEAVRAGAYDFLSKPVKIEALELALGRAVEQKRLRQEVRRLKTSASPAVEGELIGTSRAMQYVHELIARIGTSASSVLITGESGTGKELVARALHRHGSRHNGPFVAINCAALPENLLESELFGHEKGAFTDAQGNKPGLFVEAHGGTLLLDEVGELSVNLQAKLLRALEERVVRPLGGRREVPFDARLVSATNRSLEAAVEEGRFREDLFFRINVIELHLPPLRARANDVLDLATHFLAQFANAASKPVVGFTPQAAEKLLGYSWPGNVRELRNTIERAVALTAHDHITVDDLPQKIAERPRSSPQPELELLTLEEVERRHILQVLEATGGNRTLAARTLGLDRTTLWRKLERYRIELPKT
jgi:two-component system response regulator HydG